MIKQKGETHSQKKKSRQSGELTWMSRGDHEVTVVMAIRTVAAPVLVFHTQSKEKKKV